MIWYENSLVGQWQVTRQLLIFLLLKSTLSGACTAAFLRYLRIGFSQSSYGHSLLFIMRQIEQGDNITIQDALIHIRWKGCIFVRNPEGSIYTCQVRVCLSSVFFTSLNNFSVLSILNLFGEIFLMQRNVYFGMSGREGTASRDDLLLGKLNTVMCHQQII